MKKVLFILLLALAVVANAQPTRSDLAKIRVGKEGNFKYWNANSPALAQLKTFVARVTDENSTDFVPAKDRIATFDVDGTLLCETAPIYCNWMLAFHRYLHDDSFAPDKKDRKFMQKMEDYVLANGAIKGEWGMTQQYLQAKSFMGMTQKQYSDYLQNYFETEPVMGYNNLKWGTALYWPMIEVVSYLVANDFKVFLCSGDDRDLCRVLCKDIYEIPPYMMLTSDVNYVAEGMAKNGKWTELITAEDFTYDKDENLVRGDFKQLCTAMNKVVYITREIGQKPILSWGNSSGDYPMFHFTNIDNSRPHISFCLLCDDLERENGNLDKAAKCKSECDTNGWVSVSMCNEWNTIYGPEIKRSK